MDIAIICNAATAKPFNYSNLAKAVAQCFQPIRVQIEADDDCRNKYENLMHKMTELSVDDNHRHPFYRGQFSKSLAELTEVIRDKLCYNYLEGQWIRLPYFVVLAQGDDTMFHEVLRTTDSDRAINYAAHNIGKLKDQPFQVLFYMCNGAMPTVVCRSKPE